jgi:tRNA-splicing ligase RtcB (3'-phosphate/5'-hydroxy nucleic acid ligase)
LKVDLLPAGPGRWRIPPTGAMRVPGIVYATESLLPDLAEERALLQVANVACLPGIVEASYAMPDVHWGYGFPIGGVAATDVEADGVVSPGGVGFDISCGVRLLLSPLGVDELTPRLETVMDELDSRVPAGLGSGGVWDLEGDTELSQLLARGSEYAVARGMGVPADVERCEDRGVLADAEPALVGEQARARGLHQVGSLGSGNHFLEVQAVTEVFDPAVAETFGLHRGQVCVMIHCGSRGLGHQICSDHVHVMLGAMERFGLRVPDRQLACAPVRSPEGRAYLGAMAAAANYGRANRQALTASVRDAFEVVMGTRRLDLLYDVSHNLAKLEWHVVNGRRRLLCVHRKGATLALPPGHPDLPSDLRATGQPVLVPGSMGTASYVLVGGDPGGAFHSACHGAGRTMSRYQAARRVSGTALRSDLQRQGIVVRAASLRGLAEEAPIAYKNVDDVVIACERSGLARRVARLVPLGVVKG